MRVAFLLLFPDDLVHFAPERLPLRDERAAADTSAALSQNSPAALDMLSRFMCAKEARFR